MAVTVEELDYVQGAALFDACAQAAVGVSGLEFLAVYDAGSAWDRYGHAASGLVMLIPFVRPCPGGDSVP